MNACGCCACLAGAGAHQEIVNRPGLSALQYRVGTHATFLEAMIRRLTIPVTGPPAGYSLHALTTRESDDPAIAFLDAWATVGDVLTFYQERIANEGYLRTALERRSVLELGRLVGYKLKPGVSASVYLAYTVEDKTTTTIPAGSKSQSIPGADEKPQTFETSEDIEARGVWNALRPRLSEAQVITLKNVLTIKSVWIKGTATRINAGDPLLFVFTKNQKHVYAIRRALKATIDTENDRTELALEPLRKYYTSLYDVVRAELAAIPGGGGGFPIALEVSAPRGSRKKTKAAAVASESAVGVVVPPKREDVLKALLQQILLSTCRDDLQMFADSLPTADVVRKAIEAEDSDEFVPKDVIEANLNTIVKSLAAPAALSPASQWSFPRPLDFKQSSDYLPRLVTAFLPRAEMSLYAAIASSLNNVHEPGITTEPDVYVESVHVLHRSAAVFGYNAPTILFEEPPAASNPPFLPVPKDVEESPSMLNLDSPAETIARGSFVVVRCPPNPKKPQKRLAIVRTALEVETRPRTAYTISGKSTRLTLDGPWALLSSSNLKDNLAIIRRASVLTESEKVVLAQVPVTREVGKLEKPVAGDAENETTIGLDSVVEGLKPGRWVIVSGERTDTGATTGIIASELAMIAGLQLKPAVADGTPYSVLLLAPEGIKYRYKRSTVSIYGNVVKATHGETFNEILGAGDASKPLQTFNLHQKPLTFVAAATQEGIVSTLAVRVNDVLWHETDSFYGSESTDRVFVTKIADDGTVSVTFGNGRAGARLMTGPDNVRAVYRGGIGKPGNVRPRQIATAISRPLGVKDVVNPIAASGGADPESRDAARRSIPVSLQAMGRVVSVQDFADFARTFAGIDKAIAVPLSDGRRRVVHLTIGGTGGVEIDESSDVFRSLVEALRKFGDPYQPYVVQSRDKVVFAASAKVRVDPDYLWVKVAPRIRARLLDVFSYDRRDFGQVVFPAEVIAAIQSVEGVSYVDLDALGPISQDQVLDPTGEQKGFKVPEISGIKPIVPQFARLTKDGRDFLAAEIVYLPPQLADLFILTEIQDEQ
jgi:hypothetical protein